MQFGIDPGKHRSACACSEENSQLTSINWLNAGDQYQWNYHHDRRLYIEVPRVYPGIPDIDANDLIDVTWEACWWARDMQPAKVTRYEPADWKAQISKPICHHRIWQSMSGAERGLFLPGTELMILNGCESGAYRKGKSELAQSHNLLDAVGILFFGIGRLGRGMVTIRK